MGIKHLSPQTRRLWWLRIQHLPEAHNALGIWGVSLLFAKELAAAARSGSAASASPQALLPSVQTSPDTK